MNDKDKPQVSTQTQQIWGPVEGPAKDVLREATSLYDTYKTHGLARLNPTTQQAFQWTGELANQGVPGLRFGQEFANEMMANKGMTPALEQVANYARPFADGSMQEDPRLQRMLDTNANRAINGAATRFGGGRYGSAAIGQGVGQAVSDANNATMLQSNENARSRQLQASGLLGQMYESGLGRAAGATAMLPMLNNLHYDPASRLAGIGDFYQARDQAQHDMPWTQLGNYARFVNPLAGAGGTTISTAPNKSPSAAQGILGGAMAGGAMLGPWGALGGGILGAFA